MARLVVGRAEKAPVRRLRIPAWQASVTRKHLEPSVAVRLHHELGLPTSAINFDVANARRVELPDV